VIKEAKNNSMIDLLQNLIITWNIIKNEIGKIHPIEQVPSSLVNIGKLKNQTTLTNTFKTFPNNFRKIKHT
jgi:hypothetical protein